MTGELSAAMDELEAQWPWGLAMVQTMPGAIAPVSSSSSTCIPEPCSTALDLIVLGSDIHELVIAGPSADRVMGITADLGFMLAPTLPNPRSARKLADGAKAAKVEGDRLAKLLRAAKHGVLKHREFHDLMLAKNAVERAIPTSQVHFVGARRVTRLIKKDGLEIPAPGFIDGAKIDLASKKFYIYELKPSTPAAEALGLRQLRQYKDGLLYKGSFRINDQLNVVIDGTWDIIETLERYTPDY